MKELVKKALGKNYEPFKRNLLRIWYWFIKKRNLFKGTLVDYKVEKNVTSDKLIMCGNEQYGGYTIYECLDENSIVYSCGIGEDVSFDMDIIKRYGCKVFAFDPTPMAKKYIESNIKNEKFVFLPYAIAASDKEIKFHIYKKGVGNSDGSGSEFEQSKKIEENTIYVQGKTINSIMRELGHDHVDLLKLDIEGSEYDILPELVELDIKQMVVEFHGRFFDDAKNKNELIKKVMEQGKYIVVHNNLKASSQETTFIKGKYLT